MFKFKQFAIKQERAAMKVGTDGVLIGAWAKVDKAERILDIGTGTGLIAIMAAQRSNAKVVGIEIDDNAYIEACENIESSPWANRLEVYKIPLQEFRPDYKFDTIISNPPFFINSKKTPNSARNRARHTDSLSIDDLFKHSKRLLSPDGKVYLVLPYDNLEFCRKAAAEYGFYENKICYVKPTPTIPFKRVLLTYSFVESALESEELIVEEFGRHKYSNKYIELTKDFYIKM